MKRSFVMWAERGWRKDRVSDLKEGLGTPTWTNTKQRFYRSPFNPCWGGEPYTDEDGKDLVKVRVTIEDQE